MDSEVDPTSRTEAEEEFVKLTESSPAHYKLFMTTHQDSDGAILKKELILDSQQKGQKEVKADFSEEIRLYESYLTAPSSERGRLSPILWGLFLEKNHTKEEFKKILKDATYDLSSFVAGFAIDNIFKIRESNVSHAEKQQMFSAQIVVLMNLQPHSN
jgi:hypothetical protein